jgi:hypothetical protein
MIIFKTKCNNINIMACSSCSRPLLYSKLAILSQLLPLTPTPSKYEMHMYTQLSKLLIHKTWLYYDPTFLFMAIYHIVAISKRAMQMGSFENLVKNLILLPLK